MCGVLSGNAFSVGICTNYWILGSGLGFGLRLGFGVYLCVWKYYFLVCARFFNFSIDDAVAAFFTAFFKALMRATFVRRSRLAKQLGSYNCWGWGKGWGIRTRASVGVRGPTKTHIRLNERMSAKISASALMHDHESDHGRLPGEYIAAPLRF